MAHILKARMPHDTTSSASPSLLEWTENGQSQKASWRSERGASPPKRVVIAGDTTTADSAYRLACEGVGLLWRGDFQNAKHLVQALERRLDNVKTKPVKRNQPVVEKPMDEVFNLARQTKSQRARVLGMVLVPFDADYKIPLRRAPDAVQACTEAWGNITASEQGESAERGKSKELLVSAGQGESQGQASSAQPSGSVASLRELLGIISAHEWRKNGVELTAFGEETEDNYNRIHPHYGVFSPVRGEYVGLVAKAPLPVMLGKPPQLLAFDIGTGTGVLAAVLASRSVGKIIATDTDPRALACANENLERLTAEGQVQVVQADLFPDVATFGKAHLIVCNPPWLPARPSSPLERAVYDENSQMLLGFLNGLKAHLAPGGEGWLILSDLAEHLGLRTRDELLAAFDAAGLKVVARLDAKPQHAKARDKTDPLYVARSREITSLWRLGAK